MNTKERVLTNDKISYKFLDCIFVKLVIEFIS